MTHQLRNLFPGIIIILVLAAFIRFVLAPITTLEFRSDTVLFQIWGYSAHKYGLLNMYDNAITYLKGSLYIKPINYLPPYLYILYIVEWIRRLFSHSVEIGSPFASLLIKTPAILFELATILLLANIIQQKASAKWALGGAAIYAFLPGSIFTTAVWGQVDSIHTFFLIVTVWFIGKERPLLATVFWTIAFFFKMQSLALLPLLIYEIVRTSSSTLVLKSTLTGVGTAILLNLPFLLKGKALEILSVILFIPGSYPRLSINAFNVWWLAASGHGFMVSDTSYAFGLPSFVIGALYFAMATCLLLWFRSKVRSDNSLWLTAALLFFAFFMLPTEMHERYLFPFFALLLPTIPSVRWARWLLAIMSTTFMANLLIAWKISGTDIPYTLWPAALTIAIINTVIFLTTMFWITIQTSRYKDLNQKFVQGAHL